jgi:hypothetical protein
MIKRPGLRLAALLSPAILVVGLSRAYPEERAPASRPAPAAEPSWLRGDMDTRWRLVEKHLRGFDVAMLEVGHRYTELYWAGLDRNWGYAEYQLGKIETAIANGIERRPKRGPSAQMLAGPVAAVRAAISQQNSPAFDLAFATLTETCNACHRAEAVPFITVDPPATRLSPVRSSDGASSSRKEQ